MKESFVDNKFLIAWDDCYLRNGADIPNNVMQHARRSWFDTLAAMAGGAPQRCTLAAMQACTASGSDVLHPWDIALVLGTASHALDYDDVCMLATCHPSAPPVSALLAFLRVLSKERTDLQWGDILAAYLVGTETTLRLGQWLGFRHYALGFHATGTLGVIGATAACAHALKLPLKQARAALSIAASSASGLRANFGTDVKPLHVGFAAAAAVRAVLLAQAGANASDDVWDSAGFPYAYNGGQSTLPLTWTVGMPWAIASPGFEFKRYPSCYMTHRLIAGITAIRAQQPAVARGLPVQIEVEFPKHGLAPLKYPSPCSGLEGKFSAPYCAAVAWIDGNVSMASFSDSALQRETVRSQMNCVVVRERTIEGEPLESAPILVTVRGPDWSSNMLVDWSPGSITDPMSREQLLDKWRDCAAMADIAVAESTVVRLLDAPLQTRADAVLVPLCDSLLDRTRMDYLKLTERYDEFHMPEKKHDTD